MVIYEDGKVNKVPVSSQIADKTRKQIYKMYNHKKPIFISPAKKDTALLIGFGDDTKQCFRLDDLTSMEDGTMRQSGNTVCDVEFNKVILCEIIDHKYLSELHRMHNMKRTSLGFQALTGYASQELETLRHIGINI